MNENKHKIKTIQDIVDVVDSENLDRFMVDFRNMLVNALMKFRFDLLKLERDLATPEKKNKKEESAKRDA